MTHDELVERQQAFQRAASSRTAPFVTFILPMLALLGLEYLRGVDIVRWGSWLKAAAFVALVVLAVTLTIIIPRLQKRQVRKIGLACPSCGAALLGTTGQIATVTGRCGACGHRVVEPGSSQ
jgi:cytochrome bd-type quinol oxidase subunit 2